MPWDGEKISKADAGYIHIPGTNYTCHDCLAWLDQQKKCALIYDVDVVSSFDDCEYFMKGTPGALVLINPPYSAFDVGYQRTKNGSGCKRCEYFDPDAWKCMRVDENSPGPDPGMIHPGACCNLQEPDVVRGLLDDDDLSNVISGAPMPSYSSDDGAGTFNPLKIGGIE